VAIDCLDTPVVGVVTFKLSETVKLKASDATSPAALTSDNDGVNVAMFLLFYYSFINLNIVVFKYNVVYSRIKSRHV